MRIGLPVLLLATLLVGCGSSGEKVEDASVPPIQDGVIRNAGGRSEPEPFSATLTDFRNAVPALLWNGLVGVRIGRLATGYDANGDGLPAFQIREYQPDGEEKIRVLPNPLGMKFTFSDRELSDPVGYTQRIDYRTGQLDTEWHTGDAKFKVETTLHPEAEILAQKWTIQGRGLLKMRSGFSSELKWTGTAEDAVAELAPGGMPVGLRHRSTKGTWAPVRGGFEWTVALEGDSVTLYRVATWGKGASGLMVDDVAAATARIWEDRWRTDIVIDGPVEDQQMIRSFLFYLRSAVQPGGGHSVAPFGLGDATYNGHVFWDADLWVMPALVLLDPERAKEIAQYRIAKLRGARKEFEDWFGSTADLPVGAKIPNGLKFPWESSVTGKETVPGPSRLQHHISPTVVFALERAHGLGLVTEEELQEVGKGVAQFLLYRTEAGPSGREFKNTMSPDEHHTGDNDLYTNLLTEHVLRNYTDDYRGRSLLDGGRGGVMKLPRDAEGFIAYDKDDLRGYKQAAAELAVYPLQFPPAIATAGKFMERFAPQVTKNGPAMTDSIHSIIEARHGDLDRAYFEWRQSWRDFTNAPFNLFSEKRTKTVTYFTTGAAGSLQAVIYGFAGVHISSLPGSDAQWKIPLNGGLVLWGTKGRLPESWKSLEIKNLKVKGETYNLRVDKSGSRLTSAP